MNRERKFRSSTIKKFLMVRTCKDFLQVQDVHFLHILVREKSEQTCSKMEHTDLEQFIPKWNKLVSWRFL